MIHSNSDVGHCSVFVRQFLNSHGNATSGDLDAKSARHQGQQR